VLEVLFEALAEGVGDEVEADELLHLLHLRVVACRARVQALDDGRNVTEDARVHQCCKSERRDSGELASSAAEEVKILVAKIVVQEGEILVCVSRNILICSR
jgi:hypothetical protein